MQRKQMWKITIDILMTVSLLLLMTYSMVGEKAHEWLGNGLFVFIGYCLSGKWFPRKLKHKQPLQICPKVVS